MELKALRKQLTYHIDCQNRLRERIWTANDALAAAEAEQKRRSDARLDGLVDLHPIDDPDTL